MTHPTQNFEFYNQVLYLGNNFREIYSSLSKNDDYKNAPLVASPYSHFSDVRSFSGGFWKRVYKILYWTSLEEKAYENTLLKINTVIEKSLFLLQKDAHFLEKKFSNGSWESAFEKKESQEAVNRVSWWHAQTTPFLDLFFNSPEKLLFFAGHFAAKTLEKNAPLLEKLLKLEKIIHLESRLDSCLPYSTLFLISHNSEDVKNPEALKKFASCVFEKLETKEISLLHDALTNLVNLYQKEYEDKNCSVTVLELKLHLLKEELFLRKDPLHIEWRDKLQQGSILSGYILDKKIKNLNPSHESSNDHYVTYSLKNYPDRVIRIAQNTVVLGIQKEVYERYGKNVLKMPKIFFSDERGRFIIVEKLFDLDERGLEKIATFISRCIKLGITPQKMLPHRFLLDREGGLCTIAPLTGGPNSFSFFRLEKFAHEWAKRIAKGNTAQQKALFGELILKSGLSQHPHAKWFNQEVVSKCLKSSGGDDLFWIEDLLDIDRDRKKQARVLIEGIQSKIREQKEENPNHYSDLNNLLKWQQKEFFSLYIDSGVSSFLSF